MSTFLKLIKVSKNVVDVFWGTDGWEPHARLHIARIDGKVVVSHMAGTKMPALVKAMFLKVWS